LSDAFPLLPDQQKEALGNSTYSISDPSTLK
jgi:hypothetical protein